MTVILYYYDKYGISHRLPLGAYTLHDAQALINLARERHQEVQFVSEGKVHPVDTNTVQRILLVEESVEQDVITRVDDAETWEEDEDDSPDIPEEPNNDELC